MKTEKELKLIRRNIFSEFVEFIKTTSSVKKVSVSVSDYTIDYVECKRNDFVELKLVFLGRRILIKKVITKPVYYSNGTTTHRIVQKTSRKIYCNKLKRFFLEDFNIFIGLNLT